MQSTPAVFCTPAMSFGCASTPSVFKQESFPWAVKTPEASPMCWGLTPDVPSEGYSQGVPSSQPVISRELLRAVCEPFFEQMLTALQQTLQKQVMDAANQQTKPGSLQPGLHAHTLQANGIGYTQQWSYLDPVLDEASTEADDVGAFASLLSGPSSEAEGIDGTEVHSLEENLAQPPMTSQALPDDSEQASDSEKSIMVCRHWKTKGWCRLGDNCKFLHPEHKRGIAAPKDCSLGSTNDGDMSKDACPGMSTASGLPGDALSATALSRRKKRGGRNRTNKVNSAELLGLDKETTVTMLPEQRVEPCFFMLQCTQFV